MRIAICDDDLGTADYIRSLVTDWAADRGNGVEVDTFPSAEAFLFRYAECKDYQLLLLDVEMGRQNGIDLAKTIRRENEDVQIAFITGYPDFIAEGYEVSALHYLMKPISAERLFSVLDRAKKALSHVKKAILLPLDGEMLRLPVEDIQSVEAFDHQLEISTADRSHLVKLPLKEMEGMLGDTFVCVHRGCLANLAHVKKITKTDVLLDSGKTLPVSRRNYNDVNRAMLRYLKGGEDR
ncbi:MAG: response regulator transcription factor [Clostridia bacterium]|nr:response regulator transcription factor [Clostridia bacterium]